MGSGPRDPPSTGLMQPQSGLSKTPIMHKTPPILAIAAPQAPDPLPEHASHPVSEPVSERVLIGSERKLEPSTLRGHPTMEDSSTVPPKQLGAKQTHSSKKMSVGGAGGDILRFFKMRVA